MKKILILLIIVLGAFCIYWIFVKGKKQGIEMAKMEAMVVNRHSAAFNEGIDSLLNAYFALKDAFVEADSLSAISACKSLIAIADSNRLAELKKDSSGIYESAIMQLSDVKANAESLVTQTNLTEMKQDFRMIGESIYPLLKTIHYEGKTLYWQNCPMAFGEDKGANWISNTEEIINPYLGKKHPEFKSGMLHCGEVKDSIKAK
jgi:Protein of unknown function (DUF3347)